MKKNLKTLSLILPLLLFISIALLLWIGLHRNPREIPSPLLNKPVPIFRAASLQPDFKDHVTLLNVFATWCVACQAEHTVWMEARRELGTAKIIGLNYKDDPNKAISWLHQYGNPYDQIISDPKGNIGIDFGVYGTPETFLIDQQGLIRYKWIGPISPADWHQTVLPAVKKLMKNE